MLPQCVCVVSTEAPERHERTRENKKKKKRKKRFFILSSTAWRSV